MAKQMKRRDFATATPGVVMLAGNVTLTPQASTGTLSQNFPGASGSMRATGIYRVTLDEPYVSLLAHNVQLAGSGTQDLRAQLSGSSVSTSPAYVDFNVFSGSALTKPSTVGTELHVSLILKNSSV